VHHISNAQEAGLCWSSMIQQVLIT